MPDFVKATGIGIPSPEIVSSAQRRFSIKRAAEADALQKLAKAIKGVILKS